MPDVNLTIDAKYNKEEIIELIKNDLKKKYPSFDIKNIFFNVKDISDSADQFTQYAFTDVVVLITPVSENWPIEIKLVSSGIEK